MATYSLKKSYLLKYLNEVNFQDLWGEHGIFTTMWLFGKPPKILFFKNHIKNLITSLKKYQIHEKALQKKILNVININLSKKIKYNHLLRIAVNKRIISISLRKRLSPKLDFDLKLVRLKREKPEYKNLKYKKILSHLVKLDNSRSDIGLVVNNKILETGTSNLLFVKKQKIFTPIKDYYEGNTYRFFKSKIKKIIKKDILIKELKNYEEIILIGSGKGVTSVKSIKDIAWKRKSLNKFKEFSKYYKLAVNKCNYYKF